MVSCVSQRVRSHLGNMEQFVGVHDDGVAMGERSKFARMRCTLARRGKHHGIEGWSEEGKKYRRRATRAARKANSLQPLPACLLP
jgi:hypothetical protein